MFGDKILVFISFKGRQFYSYPISLERNFYPHVIPEGYLLYLELILSHPIFTRREIESQTLFGLKHMHLMGCANGLRAH